MRHSSGPLKRTSEPASTRRARPSWRGWCRSTGAGTCTTEPPTRGSASRCGIRSHDAIACSEVAMKFTAGTIAFMVLSALLTTGAPEATGAAYAGRIVGAALAPLLFAGVVLLVARLFGKARAPGAGARLVFWTVAVVFFLNVAGF